MRRKSAVRQSMGVSAMLLLVLFLMPLAVIVPFHEELFEEDTPIDEKETAPFVSGERDGDILLNVLNGEMVEEMDLGTYLLGVVRAEMPASFEIEALKAQTVAARTYTLYQLRSGGNHGDAADICTDSTCCQAYLSEEQARENWGASAAGYEAKVENAVMGTDGQVVLYGGTPIQAVFHSSSAGLTRAAGEVWLNDLPYLQAVESPEDGERIPNYYSRVEFTAERFREAVQAVWPDADLTGNVKSWLTDAETDAAGSVVSLRVGGMQIKGSALRGALGLRSACFDWEIQDRSIVFFVTGYGHGVGLSQYGANQMAEDGATYEEILTHYYSGVTVGPCPAD